MLSSLSTETLTSQSINMGRVSVIHEVLGQQHVDMRFRNNGLVRMSFIEPDDEDGISGNRFEVEGAREDLYSMFEAAAFLLAHMPEPKDALPPA